MKRESPKRVINRLASRTDKHLYSEAKFYYRQKVKALPYPEDISVQVREGLVLETHKVWIQLHEEDEGHQAIFSDLRHSLFAEIVPSGFFGQFMSLLDRETNKLMSSPFETHQGYTSP